MLRIRHERGRALLAYASRGLTWFERMRGAHPGGGSESLSHSRGQAALGGSLCDLYNRHDSRDPAQHVHHCCCLYRNLRPDHSDFFNTHATSRQ